MRVINQHRKLIYNINLKKNKNMYIYTFLTDLPKFTEILWVNSISLQFKYDLYII